MKLIRLDYGSFPEIDFFNANFRPGFPRLRYLLDTSIENILLGTLKPLRIEKFYSFFTSPSAHPNGSDCDKKHGGRHHKASDSIVTLKKNIDIARYVEHMVLDIEFNLCKADQLSGLTIPAQGHPSQFLTYIECDDPQIGTFALNISVATMHQALYNGTIDPRYKFVLQIAQWLKETQHSKVTYTDINSAFSINEAIANYCVNTLNVFQFSRDKIVLNPAPGPASVGPILIIEDNSEFRMMLDAALSELGYTILAAANGHEGLELLCQYRVNVVLVDVYLPDIDGLSIARWIRELQPSTSIVIISGEFELGTEHAYSMERVRFVTKPISIQHLDNMLRLPLG